MNLPLLRPLLLLLFASLCAPALRAHFVFVHIVRGPDARVEVHLAESAWDFSATERMVGLIAALEGRLANGDALTFERRPFGLVAKLPEHAQAASATLVYGMIERGEEPFLLVYHAKGVGDVAAAAARHGLRAEVLAEAADDGRLKLTVLFDGEPAVGAEVVVPTTGTFTEKLTTDARGELVVAMPATPLFAIRAMVAERQRGEHDGEAYAQVKHYTTLTIQDAAAAPAGSDSLAWALLTDATRNCAAIPRGAPDWSARFRASLGGEVANGELTARACRVAPAADDRAPSPAFVQQLRLLNWPDDPTQLQHPVRFAADRAASANAELRVPSVQRAFVVQDRRLVTDVRTYDDRIERVDVRDWKMTHDERVLPRQLAMTVFEPDGAIRSVALLDRSYSENGDDHFLERQTGTVLRSRGAAELLSARVTDVDPQPATPR